MFDINLRNWDCEAHPVLDTVSRPGYYPAWRNRARRFLSAGSAGVGELLDRVLQEPGELTPSPT